MKDYKINKVWEWFNAQGYNGSISVCDPKALRLSTEPAFTCKANTPDDDTFIYEQIFEIDPDYRVAAIIKEAAGIPAREWLPDGAQEPAEISFEAHPTRYRDASTTPFSKASPTKKFSGSGNPEQS